MPGVVSKRAMRRVRAKLGRENSSNVSMRAQAQHKLELDNAQGFEPKLRDI